MAAGHRPAMTNEERDMYNLFKAFVQKEPEKLLIETSVVDVELHSRHVCISKDQVIFSLDKDQIKFNPKKDSRCVLVYRDKRIPLHYYGGNFVFPGLPFQFISFFIIDEEDKHYD